MWQMQRNEGFFNLILVAENVDYRLIMIYDMIYIFNRSWVDTRWQQYITHLHTNSTLTHKQYA
jgi:hypothetical protein